MVRVAQIVQKAPLLLPALISFLAAVPGSLRWGASPQVSMVLPLLALAVIFFWALRRGSQLPSPLVFLIGLFTDLATDGPLGFWALNFLICYAVGAYGPGWIGQSRDGLGAIGLFACAMAIVTAIGWLLTSLFILQPTPILPALVGGGVAVAAFPVVSLLLGPADRLVGLAVRRAGQRQGAWL